MNLAKTIMSELIRYGKVVRPWVGIGLQNLTEDLVKSFNLQEKEGALISQVYEKSPAEKADLRVGDVVVEIDGTKIQNSQDVVREVLKKRVGQQIQFVVLREGKRLNLSVTTDQMPEEMAGEKSEGSPDKEWLGLRVVPVTPDIAKQLALPKAEGVVVEAVEAGSVAQEAGLRKGDVIFEVNRQGIKDEKDYRREMEKVKPDQGVLLLIHRRGSTFFVTLKEEK
jgi:serine protease Do